jgi:hypothetical protein
VGINDLVYYGKHILVAPPQWYDRTMVQRIVLTIACHPSVRRLLLDDRQAPPSMKLQKLLEDRHRDCAIFG